MGDLKLEERWGSGDPPGYPPTECGDRDKSQVTTARLEQSSRSRTVFEDPIPVIRVLTTGYSETLEYVRVHLGGLIVTSTCLVATNSLADAACFIQACSSVSAKSLLLT